MTSSSLPSTSSRKSKPFDAIVRAFGLLYNRLPGSYNGLVGALGYRAPDLVADALADHLSLANPMVLDAGCGTGLTAKAVHARFPGATVDGFDLSEKMLREATKTGFYRTLKPADATQALPFETGGYDAAVSSGLYTLGHVGPEALLPVLDAIKPGGLFALNIYDGAWEKLRFEKAIDQLVADGLITVRAHEQATHFGRIGQTCRVIVLDKTT
ncbi:class I SAM-dependent methyltransferase [Ahrensia marina]|uniref:class I SAM-dependent DNA methyltransferase n=1 Tax=Ahrensia marina TaxID=1514904 RepID=UPI0035CEB25F